MGEHGFDRYTHQDLHTMAMAGSGPEQASRRAELVRGIDAELQDISTEVARASMTVSMTWSGPARDVAASRFIRLFMYPVEAHEALTTTAAMHDAHSFAVSWVRRHMPAPSSTAPTGAQNPLDQAVTDEQRLGEQRIAADLLDSYADNALNREAELVVLPVVPARAEESPDAGTAGSRGVAAPAGSSAGLATGGDLGSAGAAEAAGLAPAGAPTPPPAAPMPGLAGGAGAAPLPGVPGSGVGPAVAGSGPAALGAPSFPPTTGTATGTALPPIAAAGYPAGSNATVRPAGADPLASRSGADRSAPPVPPLGTGGPHGASPYGAAPYGRGTPYSGTPTGTGPLGRGGGAYGGSGPSGIGPGPSSRWATPPLTGPDRSTSTRLGPLPPEPAPPRGVPGAPGGSGGAQSDPASRSGAGRGTVGSHGMYPPMVGMPGAGSRSEHRRPDYLLEDRGVFDIDVQAAPAVITGDRINDDER